MKRFVNKKRFISTFKQGY